MCGEQLVKSWNPVHHTNRKALRRLCYSVEGFCQLQSRGFSPGKEQIESNRLSQHTAASCNPIWNAACGFVLMQRCSTMWVGCQSRRFLCLFWRETRQRILGPEISPYPEVGRGRERELTTRPGGEAVDGGPGREQLALDSREARRESWRGTTDRGSKHRTPETVGDKIGSSEEDRLKMSAFEVLVEFSLVTHASDSPHMHIVLHTLLCSWLTPSFVRVRLSFYFLRSLDRILV